MVTAGKIKLLSLSSRSQVEFKKREHFVTDKGYDGGIDAYYIDEVAKKVIFIQSKFRTNGVNFEEKEISHAELLKMDVGRIIDGEIDDEDGNPYNGKIKQLQREMSAIHDIGRYKYEVVILANMGNVKLSQLTKLTGGFPTIIFNFKKTYNELVFPVVSGTFYNDPELRIMLNLSNTNPTNVRASYNVKTEFKNCDISLVFVPTKEIGSILYKYKNSILKYNPRSYLELTNNTVNKEISRTITARETNEFALFNNGITILSDDTNFNERIGVKDQAQVVVTNPQILNGGQTAYTLSRIYEMLINGKYKDNIFDNKEVLVKIITFSPETDDNNDARLKLIEDISRATNSQTPVNEADRRANDKIQIELQNMIYNEYGLYYERKRGEFADGIRDGYIKRAQIIDRDIFLRVCMSCDLRSAQARRNGSEQIFREDNFQNALNNVKRLPEYMFAYLSWHRLGEIEKLFKNDANNAYGVINYGQALRYGKFAVVAACNAYTSDKRIDNVNNTVDLVLSKWLDYEKYAIEQRTNYAYFITTTDEETGDKYSEMNFSGYYKGRTLDDDIKDYFQKS